MLEVEITIKRKKLDGEKYYNSDIYRNYFNIEDNTDYSMLLDSINNLIKEGFKRDV